MKTPLVKRDGFKYGQFNRDYNHDTKDRCDLKIKELIHQGHLRAVRPKHPSGLGQDDYATNLKP